MNNAKLQTSHSGENVKVTIITSSVDKNNVTTITQTTYDNTYTKNKDGSMTVQSSKSEVTNTVSGSGEISSGNTVTTTSESYNVGADGTKGEISMSTNTEEVGSGDKHNAFGAWTEFVSDYNKNHNEVYNKDMIDKGSDKTANALNIGLSVVPIAALNQLKLTQAQQIFLKGLGCYYGADTFADLTSSSLKKKISNNNYSIVYGVQHVQDGSLIKPMKTPNGNDMGERKSVGPTSFQGVWEWLKNKF